MILTIDEIKDLAQFAGLILQHQTLTDEESKNEKETEIVIATCPKKGVEDDDRVVIHFKHIAYWEEYPEEGVQPLGDPIQPESPTTDKPIEKELK